MATKQEFTNDELKHISNALQTLHKSQVRATNNTNIPAVKQAFALEANRTAQLINKTQGYQS